MLEAILFDLDGLLVDSEPLQFRAYQQALQAFGYRLEHDDWIEWHRVEASITRWVAEKQLDLDPQAVRAKKKQIYDSLIDHELELKPGAAELIEACAKEFSLAVVLSSRIESIVACLEKFGLALHFTEFMSAADLARSKPYPDVYFAALSSLNIPAAQAIALEDSVTGFRAAQAADITCIVCPDHFIPKPEGAFAGAALVVESLLELNVSELRQTHADR